MNRTRTSGIDPAEDLAAGRTTTTSGVHGADDRAAKIVASYRLTAAEIAAIRIFTLPDYSYINPAVAGSRDWLKKNMSQLADLYIPKIDQPTLMQEGGEHARKVRQALLKLPRWEGGAAYRGERHTLQTFQKTYKVGTIVPFDSFSSASKERWVAENYAGGVGTDIKTDATRNICVVLVVYHKTARDISRLSASPKKEEEVVILPGTRFNVERIIRMPRPELRDEKAARERAENAAAAGRPAPILDDEQEKAADEKEKHKANERWYTVLIRES